MYLREIKRKLLLLLPAAALFLTDPARLLPAGRFFAAAAQQEEPAERPICPDNMYAAFRNDRFYSYGGDSTQSWYDLYDSTGKLAGQTVYSPEIGVWAYYLPKGKIYRYTLDGNVYLQNTTTLSVLAQVPEEETAVSAGRSHYALFRKRTGELQIFDIDGMLCLEKQFEDTDAEQFSDWYVQLTETTDTVLVQAGMRGEKPARYSVLLYDDGTFTDSTSESFPEIFLQNGERTLGSYFLFRDETDPEARDVYNVCTKEGTLIMKGVQTGYSSHYRPQLIGNHWEERFPEQYVFLRKDRGYAVFDDRLEEIGTLEDHEDATPQIVGGYVAGLPLEALNGAVCEDSFSWCGDDAVWGRTVDGVVVWNGTEQIVLDLPAEETIKQMNDQIVYTTEKITVDGQEETRIHLRLRSDLTQEFVLPDWEVGMISLRKDSILIRGEKWWSREGSSAIYDAGLNQSYFGKGILEGGYGGNYYLERGPYEGIIDPYGNWLIRRYRVNE